MPNIETDHLSVWEVGHRWHDVDPNITDPKALPLAVQDTLRTITRLQYRHELPVCKPSGVVLKDQTTLVDFEHFVVPEFAQTKETRSQAVDQATGETLETITLQVSEDPNSGLSEAERWDRYEEFTEHWLKRHTAAVERFPLCFDQRIFERATLEQVHIDRAGIRHLCERQALPLPAFWFSPAEIQEHDKNLRAAENPQEANELAGRINQARIDDFWSRLTSKQQHRLLCRAIASELWHMNPARSIADICRDDAILKLGGGRYYVKNDTLREWIKDLDPRPEESKKGGRPPGK